MNFLLASSRQWSPSAEWIAHGVKHLVDDIFRSPNQWALYDVNPDLLEARGPRVHRLRLRSNSFHHQSLIAFSKTIIAGASPWHGNEMENFFGPIAKTTLPLWGLGIVGHPAALTSDERTSFARAESFVVTPDAATRDWFVGQGIAAHCLPCPSVFMKDAGREEPPRSDQVTVGWILDRNDDALCARIARFDKKIVSRVICPTIDDFLKLGTLFPQAARYSFDATDYVRFAAECDVIVSTTAAGANLANAALRPAIWLGGESSPQSPFIRTAPSSKIYETILQLVGEQTAPREIAAWKATVLLQWRDRLTQQSFVVPNREKWQDAVR